MVSGFSKTQQYMSLFFIYLDNIFRPIGHHVIFRKLRIRCMQYSLMSHVCYLQSHITWMLFAVPYRIDAICSPISHECYLQSRITWMTFAISYHVNAIFSPASNECCLQSHITLMLFALHASYSKFCKDDLMVVNWPKHVAKVKREIKTSIVLFD